MMEARIYSTKKAAVKALLAEGWRWDASQKAWVLGLKATRATKIVRVTEGWQAQRI